MIPWRSPLLYIGIFFILITGAALAAPAVIDWNDYRGRMEVFGSDLTGRKVRITGAIKAQLFPQPTLWLENVRVANPKNQEQDLLTVANMRVRMHLAPLVQGEIKLASIHLSEPVVAVERHADGTGSWQLTPRMNVDPFTGDNRVAFEEVTIENGELLLISGKRIGPVKVDGINATLSARSLDGPWRFRGTGLVADELMSISAGLGRIRKDSPVKFSLRLSPEEPGGLVYQFDGERRFDRLFGEIQIQPNPNGESEDDLEEAGPALKLTSKVRADFQQIVFQDIELAPADDTAGGTLIDGDARIRLGETLALSTRLNAPKIDADYIAELTEQDVGDAPALLRTLKNLSQEIPEAFEARIMLDATSVIWRGQSVDRVKLNTKLRPGRIVIDELSGSMPGQTQGTFRGDFIAGIETQQIIGDAELESLSLRDFALWIWPGRSEAINTVWTGSRGRFSLKTNLDLSRDRMRLHGGVFNLEGDRGSLDVISEYGDVPGLTLNIDAKKLNIQRFAPGGLTPAGVRSGFGADALALIENGMALGRIELGIKSDGIAFGSADAQDVDIDIAVSTDKVDIRSFDIGRLAGTEIHAQGELTFPDRGLEGTALASIKAPDADAFLEALGLENDGQRRRISRILSPIDLQLKITSQQREDGLDGLLSLTGKAGKLNTNSKTQFNGDVANWREVDIDSDFTVTSPESATLFDLLGVEIGNNTRRKSTLTGSLNGSPERGVASSLRLEALNADAQFAGIIKWPEKTGLEAEGRLALLSENATGFYEALGVATKQRRANTSVFASEGDFEIADGRWSFNNFQGTASGRSFKGSLSADHRGKPMKVAADIETGSVSLGWLLGALSLRHDTPPLTMDTRFDLRKFTAIDGTLSLKARKLEAYPGLVIDDGAIDLRKSADAIGLDLSGTTATNGKINVTAIAQPSILGMQANASLEVSAPLGDILQREDGGTALEGSGKISLKVKGDGRSPTGFLSSLSGTGDYTFKDIVIPQLDPKRFARLLGDLRDPGEIDALVIRSLRTGAFALGDFGGDIGIESGVARFQQQTVRKNDVDTTMRVFADLAAGKVDISGSFSVPEFDRLPSFEIALAGPPPALTRTEDMQAIRSFLTVNVLSKGIDQLEELQREQERILAEQKELERQAREKARERRAAREAELARLRAEEEVRRKQELRARFDALEEARRKAEELARLDAEEKARREEREKRRAEQEELRREREAARRQAEEQSRREAEAARRRAEELRLQALEARQPEPPGEPLSIVPRAKPQIRSPQQAAPRSSFEVLTQPRPEETVTRPPGRTLDDIR